MIMTRVLMYILRTKLSRIPDVNDVRKPSPPPFQGLTWLDLTYELEWSLRIHGTLEGLNGNLLLIQCRLSESRE